MSENDRTYVGEAEASRIVPPMRRTTPPLPAYVVLRVAVRGDDTYAAADDRQTVERYLYGRSFYLGVAAHPVLRATWDLVFVVERHYAAAIVARLASGLYFGRVVGDVPTVDPDA